MDKLALAKEINHRIATRKLVDAMSSILREYRKARTKFKPMYNYHEGYAIIKEEVDELWDAIKGKDTFRDVQVMKEAIQIGAMALAFLVELDKRGT